MYRIVALMVALALLASCGQQKEAGDTGQPPAEVSSGAPADTPIVAITDEDFSEFERLAHAYLRPFFDEEGTQTAMAVAPGDYFDVYILAEFSDLYPMSGAEFKLVLPEGVVVMASAQMDSTILTLGKFEEDYLMVFRCLPGPKHWLAKVICKAGEEFTGGTLETIQGQNLNFLGFTMCDVARTTIRARGGTAQLSKK